LGSAMPGILVTASSGNRFAIIRWALPRWIEHMTRPFSTRTPRLHSRSSARVEISDGFDGLKKRFIAGELWADPALKSFHVHDGSMGGIVVVHMEERFRPFFQIFSIALFEDSKVAMAIRRRCPKWFHFVSIHSTRGQRACPIRIADGAGIGFTFRHRFPPR